MSRHLRQLGHRHDRYEEHRLLPPGRLTPYMESRPLVAIHAVGDGPDRTCELRGTENGRADVATIVSLPSIT